MKPSWAVTKLILAYGRRPFASINFVTAHDGFTLHDLVSYNDKHNEANGEDNNDGESHNRSWNCGVEGPTEDLQILELRARQQRNFIATLLLSQGVPMLCHGDELGRTQLGNNNGYCQDNELTWIDWAAADEGLIAFTREVATLRREHPTFRRRRFFDGRPGSGKGEAALPDIAWLRPDASQMTEADWDSGFGRAIAVYLNGAAIQEIDDRGEPITDDSFLLCFSAHHEPIEFTTPPALHEASWQVVLDTAHPVQQEADVKPVLPGDAVTVAPRTMVVLQRVG